MEEASSEGGMAQEVCQETDDEDKTPLEVRPEAGKGRTSKEDEQVADKGRTFSENRQEAREGRTPLEASNEDGTPLETGKCLRTNVAGNLSRKPTGQQG